MTSRFPALLERPDIELAVLNLEVMPSMRLLMTAGEAVDRDNTCAFNCSYLEMDSIESFKEQMFILMCGTGAGFSVEADAVSKIPYHGSPVTREMYRVISVDDSKEGWCNAYGELMRSLLVDGQHPTWDTSKVRPAGSRLRTFGGRASGPGPLVDVFKFVTTKALSGRRLTTLDVHDINNVSARSVIVGGVRRSAQISLSDLSDKAIANCKSGAWWDQFNFRSLSNNSAVYEERPCLGQFLEEWTDLYNSRSGERGIFNRGAAAKRCAELGRDPSARYGTNPCGEILLLPQEFCNLTEVVIRATDTLDDLKRKVEMATILGTCQSALTHFPYLRPIWKENCERERLLGVSLTGIYDNPLTYGRDGLGRLAKRLDTLRNLARFTNATWADRIGINHSLAITCVKPSGTVSCLVDCASGIHPRFARFYIRRVRIDKKDPLYHLMRDQGVPVEDCAMNPQSTAVFSFPMRAPAHAITKDDVTALQHLELWKTYKTHWCEHNPSITVNYSDEEFLEVGNWVYQNFDEIQGISFLPRTDHVYTQAPYEAITQEQYNAFPKVEADFNVLSRYESDDGTISSQTMACSGGSCELVDLTSER